MIRDSPEYATQEFFPSTEIEFVESKVDENEIEKELIQKAFPEKGKDVFERSLRIAESSVKNLRYYANEGSE